MIKKVDTELIFRIINSKLIEFLNYKSINYNIRKQTMNPAKLSKILKALSNQIRLELYLQIARQNEADFDTGCECFITDIVGSLNIGAPTVYHHLKELSNADLITTERKGKFLTATINKNTIKEAIAILSESIK